jgi:hypothetical protein
MRILHRTHSLLVCRSVLFMLISICAFMSSAYGQWTTTGNDITNSNTGNVGVGKSSPAYKLDILSSIATIARFDTSASANSQVLINGASGFNSSLTLQKAGVSKWSLANIAADDRFSFFNSSSAEVLSLSQSGNLGIATTSPQDKLHLYAPIGVGTIRVQANTVAGFVGVWEYGPMLLLSNNRHPGTANNFKTTAAGSMILVGAASNPGDIAFYTTSTGTTPTYEELLRMKASGNIGIGTITPGYRLDVQGGSINSSGGLCIAGDCKTAWSQVGGSQWTTSGTTINYSTGNVGIGVASPTTKLDVNGTVNATALTVNGTAVTSSQWSTSGSTVNYSTGNVGVNTSSPSAKLHVTGVTTSGTAAFAGTNFTSHFNHGNGTEDTYIRGGKTTSKVIINDGASGGVLMAQGGGNVGIGTGSPTSKLHVAGTGRFTGDLTVDGNIAAKYQDMAEWVPAAEQLAAGTVVVLDSSKSNQVISSTMSYDTRVAGVISAQPGIVLGEKSDNKVLVATTGRVLVNVDATSGPIEIGDLLVTSDREGVAMKSVPVEIGGVRIHRPGTLIGKALEPLSSGTGKILVLLSLQ